MAIDENPTRRLSDQSPHHSGRHQKSESRRNSKNYSAPFRPPSDHETAEKQRNFSEDSSSARRQHRESSKQARTSNSHSHGVTFFFTVIFQKILQKTLLQTAPLYTF
jgi:hypothetical protein